MLTDEQEQFFTLLSQSSDYGIARFAKVDKKSEVRQIKDLVSKGYASNDVIEEVDGDLSGVSERLTRHMSKNELRELFERADEIASSTLKGRPRKGHASPEKKTVTVRLEKEVVDWLKEHSPQTSAQVNAFLVALMEAEAREDDLEPTPE